MRKLSNEEIKQFADAYNQYGTLRAAAARIGISHGKASHKRYARALELGLIKNPKHDKRRRTREELKPITGGRVRALPATELSVPPPGEVKRYIFTCAQNNTRLYRPAWENLLALAEHYNARIMVSRFVYDKRCQAGMDKDSFMVAPRNQADPSEVYWDAELDPYLSDERVIVAPGLVWCGEMNILPTAVRPLSGLEAYTGRKSSIFPHVKLAMKSIPSGKHEATKFIYTTGTITQRNYIQRKAGLKADFHHCYGGLLVEVDSDGNWFVRQLNADGSGAIYDLTLRASNGEITDGHEVEGITWGDIHVAQIDPVVAHINWEAPDSIEKVLRPRHQFFHDLVDFRARIHHDRKNPHVMFKKYVHEEDDVENELKNAMLFLQKLARQADGRKLIVVNSNHDNAFSRWLREADYRYDPVNSVFFLRAQLACYEAINRKDKTFHLLRWAAEQFCDEVPALFLHEDESYIICEGAGDGIECGMHGHLGPNGTRGGANAFAKMGRKSNVGHTHQAGIHDGVYTAGTTSLLDMAFNKGPSSWSQSNIATYKNGKRTIITIWNGKWRAT